MKRKRAIKLSKMLGVEACRAMFCLITFLFVLRYAEPVAAQTPPPFPSQVSVTRGTYPGGVRIWWTPVEGANAYDIWRSDVPQKSTAQYYASVPGSRHEFIDTSIPAKTSYHYWVRTVIHAGVPSDFGYSHEGFWVPGPAAPENVQATDGLHPHRIHITWNQSTSATGYEVWRSVNNDPSTAVQIATTNDTNYWDDQVDLQSTYYYWIKARNSEGTSGFSWSNPGFAKPAPPETVSGLTASNGEFLDFIRISWNAASGATRYEIWRADSSEQWRSERVAEVVGATSYDDADTKPLDQHTYWVRAVNSVGYGDFSGQATGFRELKLPDKPMPVMASEGMYAGRIRVAWMGADRAMEYEVLRNVVRDLSSAEVIARVPAEDELNEFWDSSAEGGRVYFYWIRGVNQAGAGDNSWSTNGYWNPGPDAPSFVQATEGTLPTAVEVTWVAPSNASSYEVWRHSVPEKEDSVLIGTTANTSFLDENAVVGELYFYWVKASNAQGTSGFSWSDSGYAEGPEPVLRSFEVSTATALESENVTLTVNLTTPGSENAFGFSLQFDPSLLEFKSMSAGEDLPSGAMMLEKLHAVSFGQVGTAVALAPGTEFDPGTFELLTIEFAVQPGAAGRLAPVSFGDEPTPRDIVSVAAELLAAQWMHGNVQVLDQAMPGYEADVTPMPEGDGQVNLQDWVQIGRWVAGLDPAPTGSLFQRADCAPRETLGDDKLSLADWVQAGRYAQGLEPLTETGETSIPQATFFSALNATVIAAAPTQEEASAPLRVRVKSGSIAEQEMVPVLMESDGGVNAVSFTIEFDASSLKYEEVVLGPEIDESGGMLILNDQYASEGSVGFMVAMPTGQSLPDGIRKLVDLHVSLLDSDNEGSLNLALTDMPVDLAVSDSGAHALDADFESGTLTIGVSDEDQGASFIERPRMQSRLDGARDEIALSWASRVGKTYRVERSVDLFNWHPVDRITGQPDRTEFRNWVGTDSQVFIRVVEE